MQYLEDMLIEFSSSDSSEDLEDEGNTFSQKRALNLSMDLQKTLNLEVLQATSNSILELIIIIGCRCSSYLCRLT